MKIFIHFHFSLIFLCSCSFVSSRHLSPSPEEQLSASKDISATQYLIGRQDPSSPRYLSFVKTIQLLDDRKARILVETGTARYGDKNLGEGGSTIIFGDWATQNNALLYTVDISPTAIENAKSATIPFAEHIKYICGDSVNFLKFFGFPIDFLYLDSYDYDQFNPKPSQKHHLKEITAAYPYLHKNSVVMIDDCALPNGGKGKRVIKFLKEKGWEIIYEGYQVILIKPSSTI